MSCLEKMHLALETSRHEASLALAWEGGVLASSVGPLAHASELLPRLEALLLAAGRRPGAGPLELEAIFVGLGPGSYTGLRVGIALALGLARACGAALHGVPSFEALAWAGLEVGGEASVALDARAGRFYHARYRRSAQDVEVLGPAEACSAGELAARCEGAPLVLGHPGLAEASGLVHGALRIDLLPGAEALLELGRLRVASGILRPAPTLEPLYLMGFGRAAGGTTGASEPGSRAPRGR